MVWTSIVRRWADVGLLMGDGGIGVEGGVRCGLAGYFCWSTCWSYVLRIGCLEVGALECICAKHKLRGVEIFYGLGLSMRWQIEECCGEYFNRVNDRAVRDETMGS
jgi:hypothetical protein